MDSDETARGFSLGKEGEEEWRHLWRAYRLAPRGEVVLVVSDSRDVRSEVRRRLEAMAPRLEVVEPGNGVVLAVHACAKASAEETKVPVVWIEAPAGAPEPAEAERWFEALALLNQTRDALQMEGPCHVVLAGPRALQVEAARRAPDLSSVMQVVLRLGKTLEDLGRMPSSLTWLHLSDLHVKAEDWQQDRVLEALVRDLPGLLAERDLQPDLMFVTGDVAYSGQRTEYDGAFLVLDEVAKLVGLDRREHVFVVPGNHDVDRMKIGRTAKRDRESLLKLSPDELRGAVGELLESAEEFNIYGKRLTEWCGFTQAFLGRARSVDADRPWRSDVADVGGLKIGVLSLCTAWASGEDGEKGRLLLGERQLHDMLAEAKDGGARLVVALMHHPTDWLHDGEHAAVRGHLEREADLVLHGHTHRARAAANMVGGSRHAVLGAGATYAGLGQDRYHGFSVGRIDFGAGRLAVHHFTWSTDSERWHPHAGVPRADDAGVVEHSFLVAGQAAEQPLQRGHDVLATRLRHAAARVYSSFVFAGLGAGGPRKHATLDQIFVPLRLSAGKDETIELGELEARLSADEPEHLVVLGDPGSGKSTLARYLAHGVARQEGGPVPVVLTVRDWIAEGKREGLLKMAERQAGSELQVRTSEEALEKLCEQGRVILFVDGIDEAADSAVREKLRSSVHGFAERFPKVSVLATSRVAGYHHAPLDNEFRELTLEPFDNAAIEDFVHRWYDFIEDNPTERLRRRVDLLNALEVEPRVKALARNPLLATLIAMVHFSHARLPGERAKLYGKVIELLLITWPAERGREFGELHGSAQQPMLEKLALRLQEQRAASMMSGAEAEVLIDRAHLVEMLAEQLGDQFPSRGEHERRHLARTWVEWLVKDSGLLQEQQPGRLGFPHLSLMEYMAGRALLVRHLEAGYCAVAQAVAKLHDRDMWHETLLLMLGSQNTKRELGQTVVAHLLDGGNAAEQPAWSACLFGLALLREEVDMGAQRERLLDAAILGAVERWPYEWNNAVKAIDEVLRFGRIHRERTRAWLEGQLKGAHGVELCGVVAMAQRALKEGDIIGALDAKDEHAQTVLTLMEFGPQQLAGRWAREQANTETWRRWAQETPLVGILWRSLEDAGTNEVGGVWISTFMKRSAWLGGRIEAAARSLQSQTRRRERHGLPSSFSWSFEDILCVRARFEPATCGVYPCELVESDFSLRLSFYFSHESLREFSLGFSPEFSLGFSRDFSLEVASELSLYYPSDFNRYLGCEFSRYFSSDFLFELSKRTSLHYSLKVALGLSSSLLRRLSWQENDQGSSATASSLWEQLRQASTLNDAHVGAANIFCAIAAELHAGLVASAGLQDPAHAPALEGLRIQNRWINLFFTPLVEYATRNRPVVGHPHLHALLLTYGLAQYQTTWEWPDCPHWRAWFAEGPPEHWLPAHVWHLVRSIQDPDDPTHRQNADACLDRNDWPELAQDLRDNTVVPTPPEVLALFDRSEPSAPSN